ncbi:FAD:protein FMN transferase [Micromonospora sp. LH3U1]|uniref:FAD:protein FMN transferase n=1 Tax=Micromonospora sp. LH3U1 TaxID=3018339 RepID=UPI00234AD71B|nr:FAD:protein FMN transferase [Micromonospora sp. LH3U1]WCN78673.1 FAD:protein FMN transferase [Micromonospora sp. LH3U1]
MNASIAATQGRDHLPTVQRHTCEMFTCDITLASNGPPATPFTEVQRRLRELDQRYSRFRADSELSQLNTAAGQWHHISDDLHAMLRHALAVAVASAGLVNVAMLPRLLAAGYVRSWGTGAPTAAPPTTPTPVPPLASLLELRHHSARLAPGYSIDIGALAKGRWADDVVTWLGPNSAASIGGDVTCHGPGPAGDGWPVELPNREVLLVRDGGVATSGTGKRRWGNTGHHLIDPRTGQPATSDITQTTVLAATGACADWVASAVVIGGSPAADRLTGRTDVHRMWLSRADKGERHNEPHQP